MSGASAIHLKPAAPLAERVLLPGDPHRALAVAQDLLEHPLMFNHARGLWGYTGEAADGLPLTIQATGMGGPSAALVVEELVGLGARTLIRIGTCGALIEGFGLGEVVAVQRALSRDGASAALGAGDAVPADPSLATALASATGRDQVTAVTTDLFYDPRAGTERDPLPGWRERGAAVVEMEAAAILRVAELRGARAGCVLAVTDLLASGERIRMSRDDVEEVGLAVGRAAWSALESEGRRTKDEGRASTAR